MKNIIKKIVLATVAILFLTFIFTDNPIRNHFYDWTTEKIEFLPKRNEHWVNVFVHGSFSSLLGFLSLKNVVNDNVDDTNYKKLTNKMRQDSFFYNNQPMLKEGLIKIEPTFDVKKIKNTKLVAYPIIKAYQTIAEKIMPKHQVNHFYTYGWSGLLSLSYRRKEAVRFFNELNTEIERYQSKGINPKIRILSHSHGGNLVLNLAAVNKVLSSNLLETKKTQLSKNPEKNESLLKMTETIKNLATTPQETINKKGQKIWDYIPTKAPIIFDEVVFYGVPVQPETEPFYFNKTFKKTYLFYSQEDHIQKADWVTSKRLYSEQRLNNLIKKIKKNKFIQAKLMIGREVKNDRLQKIDLDLEEEKPKENQTFLRKIFGGKKMFKRFIDPTHTELWCTSWTQESEKKNDLFGPFPIAILTSVLIKAIENLNLNDIDINIDKIKNDYIISAAKHNEEKIQTQINFSTQPIKEMIPKFTLWKPTEDSKEKEFSIISSYLN